MLMRSNGSGYTHGGSAGKNLKLLMLGLCTAILHTLLWGCVLLACTVSVWYAAAAAGALALLIVLRFFAGKSA